jgi:hypothetical protein
LHLARLLGAFFEYALYVGKEERVILLGKEDYEGLTMDVLPVGAEHSRAEIVDFDDAALFVEDEVSDGRVLEERFVLTTAFLELALALLKLVILHLQLGLVDL